MGLVVLSFCSAAQVGKSSSPQFIGRTWSSNMSFTDQLFKHITAIAVCDIANVKNTRQENRQPAHL